jgi:hypothetical protein
MNLRHFSWCTYNKCVAKLQAMAAAQVELKSSLSPVFKTGNSLHGILTHFGKNGQADFRLLQRTMVPGHSSGL